MLDLETPDRIESSVCVMLFRSSPIRSRLEKLSTFSAIMVSILSVASAFIIAHSLRECNVFSIKWRNLKFLLDNCALLQYTCITIVEVQQSEAGLQGPDAAGSAQHRLPARSHGGAAQAKFLWQLFRRIRSFLQRSVFAKPRAAVPCVPQSLALTNPRLLCENRADGGRLLYSPYF